MNFTPSHVRSDSKTLWITGAGTGIGRAIALTAAAAGWQVGLSGRRPEALQEVARAIEAKGGRSLALPLDSRDASAVRDARDRILDEWGELDALAVSAGLNVPERGWDNQNMNQFRDIVDTNLLGTTLILDAALPALRQRQGSVVVVSSYAGWHFQPGAGVAYSASKTALSSICRSLNHGEAEHGIRACHLCPGDVATDFLQHRPIVPGAEARSVMLSPDDVARSVQFVLDSPQHVRIDELVISPVSQR